MTNDQNLEELLTANSLEVAFEAIWNAAQTCKNDPLSLLAILRQLEELHQEIRDTLFQEALPDNRQALYLLLKDIEANGGWPYIYRSRLRELIDHLSPNEVDQLISNETPPPTPSL